MVLESWLTDAYIDKPTNCMNCGAEFEKDPLFQAEVRHEIVLYGISAGEYLINEKYDEWHASGHQIETWETTKDGSEDGTNGID